MTIQAVRQLITKVEDPSTAGPKFADLDAFREALRVAVGQVRDPEEVAELQRLYDRQFSGDELEAARRLHVPLNAHAPIYALLQRGPTDRVARARSEGDIAGSMAQRRVWNRADRAGDALAAGLTLPLPILPALGLGAYGAGYRQAYRRALVED